MFRLAKVRDGVPAAPKHEVHDMATEYFGEETHTEKRKGRAPLTLNGKAISPKAWVKLNLQGAAAEDYATYKQAEKVLRDKFLAGLTAKHIKDRNKYGVMLSMKGDKPSYVICDKSAAGSSEGFSF
jgi:hypothetical protein